jgi:hypothetical protein
VAAQLATGLESPPGHAQTDQQAGRADDQRKRRASRVLGLEQLLFDEQPLGGRELLLGLLAHAGGRDLPLGHFPQRERNQHHPRA